MKRIALTLFTALTAPLTFANGSNAIAQVDTATSNALFPPLFEVQDNTVFGLPSLMSQEPNVALLTQKDTESEAPKLDLSMADKKTTYPAKKWEHALPFLPKTSS